jgi:NAD(P)-dependent dehydrogenase (short-subunit alcohol dehydrogenase family)
MLDGTTALVIGGHSGFGAAITRRFAAEGAHVVIGGRRRQLVDHVAAEVGGTGVVVDITDDAQVAAAVEAADRVGNGLSVTVNSAGYQQSTPLAELTPEKLKAMHEVQLVGALYCMRHAGTAMAARGGGSFVSISSLTAHNPALGLAAYGSAKAGLEYATQIAAVEYGAQGVRFNCVAASLIETPMTAEIFRLAPAIQAQREVTPLGRMGTPDDIARAVLFFASDLGGFVTGQTLCVDGGASLLCLPTPQMYADVGRRVAEAAAAAAAVE